MERDRECGGGGGTSRTCPLLRCESNSCGSGVLESTRVGQVPGRVLMAEGPDMEEEDLESIEMWAPEEEGLE